MADRCVGHEPSAIAVPRILGVGAILAVTVIVVVVVVHGLVRWVAPEHALVVARNAAIPPAPRLQPHPGEAIAALRAQNQAQLSTWAWADPTHEFARISIDRAMELYVRQHAPATSPGGAAPGPRDATP